MLIRYVVLSIHIFSRNPNIFPYNFQDSEVKDKTIPSATSEDTFLQKSTRLSSSRPPLKSKSTAHQTAAFLQQEATKPSVDLPKLNSQKFVPVGKVDTVDTTADSWDNWSDDFVTVEAPPVPKVEEKRKLSTGKLRKLSGTQHKESIKEEIRPVETNKAEEQLISSAVEKKEAVINLSSTDPVDTVDPETTSWNDWDQDVEVEATEIVLETPVTQMHISTQSTTPPRTIDDEIVHGAPKFVIQSMLEEVLDDPEKIKELPEEEKKELERKIQDSLHLEVSKYYENDSTHEWDDDEEVDWSVDQSSQEPLIHSQAPVSETIPKPDVTAQPLDTSNESIDSEGKEVPYEQLNEELADDENSWGETDWRVTDNIEPELQLEEVTQTTASSLRTTHKNSKRSDETDVPPPFSPTEKAELEKKIKLSLISEADKFFQTSSQDEFSDWGANWAESYSQETVSSDTSVPLSSTYNQSSYENVQNSKNLAVEDNSLTEGERNIIFGDEDSLRFEVSSDGIGDDGKSYTGSIDSRIGNFLDRSKDQVDEPEIEVEPVIVKKFAYKCGEDEDGNLEGENNESPEAKENSAVKPVHVESKYQIEFVLNEIELNEV